MNYPVWELDWAGGGLLIALIASVHVYIAHFAVGGGLFLVLTEAKALRDNDPGLMAYVRSHTKFFLLVTMVAGSLTGMGVWLTISVLNPSATSTLIHTFVFAWSAEWACFMVEIISLVAYYYTFGMMKDRDHLIAGWIYFIFAWLSLFFVAAIVAFMLTPGGWVESGSFWDAFLNPTFLPSLAFRSSLALILAGVYGLITATRIEEDAQRQKTVRWCALWLVAPFAALAPATWWYLSAAPPLAQSMILRPHPDLSQFVSSFQWLAPVLVLGGLFYIIRAEKSLQQTVAYSLMLIALVYMGSFEAVRESSRRPFVINGYMYSNSIKLTELFATSRKGVLASAKWSRYKQISPDNQIAAGRELFQLLCASCHSLGGFRNDILARTRDYDYALMDKTLNAMGVVKKYMPPFAGTSAEKGALSKYLLAQAKGSR